MLWVCGATTDPGATAKVSMLRRLTKLFVTLPVLSASRSPRYQATPNGLFATWMTNRSVAVLGARPLTETVSFSAKPSETILAVAFAFVAQVPGRPAERIRPNDVELAAEALESGAAAHARSAAPATRPRDKARVRKCCVDIGRSSARSRRPPRPPLR